MATETVKRSAVSLKLAAGVNEAGRTIVKSCSMGKVAPNADADKIMLVATSLGPVLAYPVTRVERTNVTLIED
ncbi:MAG: DUF1659 domain-containing protein [Fretibacterium sp.]|nr:DUF1659 domain-containing protein [Fretibacterium sp.]